MQWRHYFLEEFKVHSKTERKEQRFPIYPLPWLLHNLPIFQQNSNKDGDITQEIKKINAGQTVLRIYPFQKRVFTETKHTYTHTHTHARTRVHTHTHTHFSPSPKMKKQLLSKVNKLSHLRGKSSVRGHTLLALWLENVGQSSHHEQIENLITVYIFFKNLLEVIKDNKALKN